MKPELDKVFKPAFLGRLSIVPYYPVRDEALRTIIKLKLNKVRRRLEETHKIALEWEDSVIAAIEARSTEVESGARNVDHILTRTLLPEISREFLARMAAGDSISRVHISLAADGSFQYDIH